MASAAHASFLSSTLPPNISNTNCPVKKCWNFPMAHWCGFCKQKQLFICNPHNSSSKAAASKEQTPEAGRQPSSEKGAVTNQNASGRKRGRRAVGRGLPAIITIKRSDGTWLNSWVAEQVTTLKELGVNDMAANTAEGNRAESQDVGVALKVQKTGWGFFVNGQVTVSVSRRCSGCSISFMREVDAPFQAWLTPTRDSFSHPQGIGEDNDDPTVLYFPPSEETADLTDIVRDTLHLSLSAKDTCSNTCANSGPRKWHSVSEKKMDSSWLPLLAIKSKKE
ncbi:hypothetical protein O6H91_11G021200 [Diphasiastrum complanatum]|uniref:Uncharacterized protein n=2 Tax=Diphasiastrum complanatum TaxID=34168 RepID=A0ACC2C7B1_DIPCM|nr:hypothetical protein O6H91_11G021200 [Diphasiastrum complanatum]KAJ7537759.1 hypothetical protein O6H91_11G021200 [Diphasiastrum complanatum]